jgi:hypothetical protein
MIKLCMLYYYFSIILELSRCGFHLLLMTYGVRKFGIT